MGPGVVAKIHVINLPIKNRGQEVKKVCLLKSLGDGFCLEFGTLHVITKYFNFFNVFYFPFLFLYYKVSQSKEVELYLFICSTIPFLNYRQRVLIYCSRLQN